MCLQELLGEPGHGAEARPDGGHDKGRHDGDGLHDRNTADAGPSVSAWVLYVHVHDCDNVSTLQTVVFLDM